MPHRFWASARPARPRAESPSVNTHTEVVSRTRVVSGTGVVVRYVVQTSVVETYRRPQSPAPRFTRVSTGAQ